MMTSSIGIGSELSMKEAAGLAKRLELETRQPAVAIFGTR
jgi:hypothetical protein